MANRKVNQVAGPFQTHIVDSLPKVKVGLLLGTSKLLSDSSPNLYFVYRIEAAVKLYKEGKIQHILVSGDHSKENYNEPEDMRNALVAYGVPDSVIHLDYAGLRTLDSVVRAKEIFGQQEFIIISQKFHNQRAIYLARENQINAWGFNARDVDARNGLKTQIREFFARDKMFLDVWFGKEPRFLGEQIEI